MAMPARNIARKILLTGLFVSTMVAVAQSAPAPQGSEAPPRFTYDGSGRRLPLPNKWTFEGITGLVVDKDDVIWVLQRPGDFDIDPIFRIPEKTENYASLNPPTASCCVKPEACSPSTCRAICSTTGTRPTTSTAT